MLIACHALPIVYNLMLHVNVFRGAQAMSETWHLLCRQRQALYSCAACDPTHVWCEKESWPI